MRVDLADSVRRFWDADAATYDRSPDHGAATPTERAAWSAALARSVGVAAPWSGERS